MHKAIHSNPIMCNFLFKPVINTMFHKEVLRNLEGFFYETGGERADVSPNV